MLNPATKENEEDRPPTKLIPRLPGLGLKRPQFKAPAFHPLHKKPAPGPASQTNAAPSKQADQGAGQPALYFSVLYTKYQPSKKMRKNKSFIDGVLEIKAGNVASLFDDQGKVVVKTTLRGYDAPSLGNGSSVIMGNWELEVDSSLPADKFLSGAVFVQGPSGAAAADAVPLPAHGLDGSIFNRPVLGSSNAAFKRPVGKGGLAAAAEPKAAYFLHDPHAAGAVVLNAAQWANGAGRDAQGRPVSPVVLDPHLARQMRPHQIEGVRFLYECTMGLRDPGRFGAILADAMGLGKTLTTLALLWTLLKQGPSGRPVTSKAVVVTPSSLTANWAEEARKWLGKERMATMVLAPGADGAQQVVEFRHGSVTKVCITSYETLRRHAPALAGGVGLWVADEGHRLKSSAGNKTISALTSLGVQRRVLLTGTPLQNNLSEFWAMVEVVNPDVLGSLSLFERVFGGPIARSRDRDATAEEKDLGSQRSHELARRVDAFVLRRGAEINARYLPPLSLFVVFCRPAEQQLAALREVLGSGTARGVLGGGAEFGDQTLKVITTLRKICNHPALSAAHTEGEDEEKQEGGSGKDRGTHSSVPAASADARKAAAGGAAPPTGPLSSVDLSHSGKLSALAAMLDCIVGRQGGRCVVVSGSTAVLDLVQGLCGGRGWSTCRVDGSTEVSKRQDVVNAFNRHNVGQVFLLSTTAGGAGLNLTGASRLVLVDSHWNPALDAQAMARVWRDGQRSPCVVYRLLTTGTVEEKVYQRQRAKGDIAAMMTAGGDNAGGSAKGKGAARGQFSREELRQLFTLRTDTACDTADVLAGGVAGAAFVDVSGSCGDAPLAAAVAAGHVTFVHLEKKQEAPEAGAVDGEESEKEEEGGTEPSAGEGAGGDPCCPDAVGAGEGGEGELDGASQLQLEEGCVW